MNWNGARTNGAESESAPSCEGWWMHNWSRKQVNIDWNQILILVIKKKRWQAQCYKDSLEYTNSVVSSCRTLQEIAARVGGDVGAEGWVCVSIGCAVGLDAGWSDAAWAHCDMGPRERSFWNTEAIHYTPMDSRRPWRETLQNKYQQKTPRLEELGKGAWPTSTRGTPVGDFFFIALYRPYMCVRVCVCMCVCVCVLSRGANRLKNVTGKIPLHQ